MKQIRQTIRQMIRISNSELDNLLRECFVKNFRRRDTLSRPGETPNEIFFINEGVITIIVTDREGVEHTTHFALENQFIADYSSFLKKQPSIYTLRAIENTEVVVLPRSAIEWGYENLKEGEKLGRLVAEFYFMYQDNRIKDLYARTPKERYENITEVFPNIHNRVPQHMIASYLGITPVHLSRLKRPKRKKV